MSKIYFQFSPDINSSGREHGKVVHFNRNATVDMLVTQWKLLRVLTSFQLELIYE